MNFKGSEQGIGGARGGRERSGNDIQCSHMEFSTNLKNLNKTKGFKGALVCVPVVWLSLK